MPAKSTTEQSEIVLQPSADQLGAWSSAAGDMYIDAWLVKLADEAAAPIVERSSWPAVIKLKEPIVFGSRTVESLTMRRGQLGDLKGIKLGGEVATEQLIAVASRMCGEPTQIIERLAPEDSGEVMSLVLDFFAKSLTSGRKR